jgi:hypothetical protein
MSTAAPASPVRGQEPPFTCRHPHGAPGSYDETARRASHEELQAALVFSSEGHHVRTVAQRQGARTPDFLVCGTSVEVKSFLPLAERGGVAPSARSVANKLLDARGQGSVAVIWAHGSGLSEGPARAGVELFRQQSAKAGAGRIRAVRLIGDGFDVIARPGELRAAPPAGSPARARTPLAEEGPGGRRRRSLGAQPGAAPRPRMGV